MGVAYSAPLADLQWVRVWLVQSLILDTAFVIDYFSVLGSLSQFGFARAAIGAVLRAVRFSDVIEGVRAVGAHQGIQAV